jgi:inhibitor of KinA
MTTAHALDIVRILPAGDAALLIEFEQAIDPRINDRAIALGAKLRRRCGTAVRDAVVGFATLTVYFNPLVVDGAWMEAEVLDSAATLDESVVTIGAAVDVPVCYGGEFGPDLGSVAAFGGCTEEEVIALHGGTSYRVYMVGFVPGFAYMAAVDTRIAAPRRATPRVAVPAGSVAIASGQTGIYPAVTPGGWNIIGRTPLRPYDPERHDPFLFQPGDTATFRPVTRDEFDRIR